MYSLQLLDIFHKKQEELLLYESFYSPTDSFSLLFLTVCSSLLHFFLVEFYVIIIVLLPHQIIDFLYFIYIVFHFWGNVCNQCSHLYANVKRIVSSPTYVQYSIITKHKPNFILHESRDYIQKSCVLEIVFQMLGFKLELSS